MPFVEWKYMKFYKNYTDFVPKGPLNNIPVLVGAKPLCEPMMVNLPTYKMHYSAPMS